MSSINLRLYHERKIRHRTKRKKLKRKKRHSYHLLQIEYRKSNPKNRRINYRIVQDRKYHYKKKPRYSDRVKHFINVNNAFANEKLKNHSNIYVIPTPFSMSDNYNESCVFLRKLFNGLYNQSNTEIIIDYGKCSYIDVDASICMDIILADFINYYNSCIDYGKSVKVKSIRPINYENDVIKKMLFSIGAFSTLRQENFSFENVIPFKLKIGNKSNKYLSKIREVHITQVVDYIIECLNKLNRTLTAQAETNLYRVVGEVIINAEEHSSTSTRYLIGYFEDHFDENKHTGIFNLAILNWGLSIYETFKSPNCKNVEVLQQMKDLSKKYTQNSFFKPAELEEETLWTLYALQEGVTRKADWKRGNGSIRFIESFFKLKGNDTCDNITKMSITSGNTQIVFDGSYGIVEKKRGNYEEVYKMMTFNKSGNIEDKPDKEYVKFTGNFFPGTLITAKIHINEDNTEKMAI